MRSLRLILIALLLSPFSLSHADEASLPATASTVLPTYVVTATRGDRQLLDVPHAMTVIESSAIEQSNFSNTPDLFRYAEGVYIQKTNLGGGSPFIRGLTGKQVLLLVDGVRLNNSFYRFGPHQYLNTIDPNLIDHIEIVRGPSSVLYGSDALGGAINIITKRRMDFAKERDVDGLLQTLFDSAVEGGATRAQLSGNLGPNGLLGGITGKYYDDLEGGGDIGEQHPSGYDELDADVKFNRKIGDRQEVIFAGQYTRQWDVPKTSEVTLGDKLKFNYEPQERTLLYGEYRAHALGIFDNVRLNLSYHRQREGEEIIQREDPLTETRELTDVETYGITLQLANRLWDHQRFTYGVDYYRDTYDTRKIARRRFGESRLTPGVPDGALYESLGVFWQDEVVLGSYLELIGGVRYSQFNSEGEIEGEITSKRLRFETDDVTGSVHALIHLLPELSFVAGYSEGFRAPNMEDFFGRVDFFSEIPNTDLKPEKSFNWEVGFKYQSPTTFADVYYYQSDYEDLIERVTVGLQPDGSPIQQRRNITKAFIRGVEAGINHRFNKHWSVAATVLWTEGEDRKTDEPLRRIPPLNGTLRLRYTHNPQFWLEWGSLWADRQDRLSQGDREDPRIPEGGTPGYVMFNIKAGYHRNPREQLLLSLENVADKQYKTHGSGIFAPGRSVVLSYRIAFD